ncbi:aldose 1-epimerase-like protein [Strigomonas culicis]|nr:aldose 1-epimerase-like protein [Strigomonas culicis]|eukprot:EPY21144.1 aldose 1-epimerase-like protein [Strigomonas culicis]
MKSAVPSLITNHCLQVPAKHVAVMTEDFVLKGEMSETTRTVNDYNEMRPIINGMLDTEEMGRDPWGYDDTIALDTWDATLREAATLYSPDTQLQMRISTTNPVVTVYTANALPKDADGTFGKRFQRHSGVALMCQYFPNSPNVPSFPSTVLNKGETYQETTVHEFQFLSAKPVLHATPPPMATAP